MLAGYGIAIPVGAIAILIVETGLRRGFTAGFMAGAGAATGDLLFATIAVVAGAAIAAFIAPYSLPLRIISGVLLMLIGAYGLLRLRRGNYRTNHLSEHGDNQGNTKTYVQFLALTLLNPLTIAYFAILIIGTDSNQTLTAFDRIAFVLGAGLASLSWQTLLAGTGSFARQHLSPHFQLMASMLGNIIVAVLGIRILVQALS
jgi:threonine/homoserine/homoserine lactone efflux protein